MIKTLRRTVRFVRGHPLARRRLTPALGRYFWWQFRQRVSRQPMVMRFVNASRLRLEPGAHGLTGYFYVGLPDFDESAFALHLLRPGDGFADVGANSGAWTILAAGGAGARVDSFEPIAGARRQLTDNVNLNGLADTVQIHPVGVSSESGRLRFTSDHGPSNRVIAAGEQNETQGVTEVDVVTLDYAYADRCPVLLKIDVEGWELEVIKGAHRLLARPEVSGLIIETFRRHNLHTPKLQEMEAILAAHGFQPYAYHPFERRLGALESVAMVSDNTIYVRDLETVQRRLREASPFSIQGQQL